MLFTGFYEHTIDAKNRLAIPAELRALVLAERGGSGPVVFYVTPGENRSLCLYLQREFEKRAEALDDSELDPEQVLAYEEVLFGLTRRVEMDAQGRIRLPESLLTMTKLGTEVVLVGNKDHLRIRDRAEWLARVEQVRESGEAVLNPRRLLRRPAKGE